MGKINDLKWAKFMTCKCLTALNFTLLKFSNTYIPHAIKVNIDTILINIKYS